MVEAQLLMVDKLCECPCVCLNRRTDGHMEIVQLLQISVLFQRKFINSALHFRDTEEARSVHFIQRFTYKTLEIFYSLFFFILSYLLMTLAITLKKKQLCKESVMLFSQKTALLNLVKHSKPTSNP